MEQLIVKRSRGEYSTIRLPDGMVETVWFPDDQGEPSVTVGRTWTGLAAIAEKHIHEWEQTHEN